MAFYFRRFFARATVVTLFVIWRLYHFFYAVHLWRLRAVFLSFQGYSRERIIRGPSRKEPAAQMAFVARARVLLLIDYDCLQYTSHSIPCLSPLAKIVRFLHNKLWWNRSHPKLKSAHVACVQPRAMKRRDGCTQSRFMQSGSNVWDRGWNPFKILTVNLPHFSSTFLSMFAYYPGGLLRAWTGVEMLPTPFMVKFIFVCCLDNVYD